jgi:hypothetical protein
VAEKYCRYMLVGDLDEIDLEEHFKEETYDCILMADILQKLAHERFDKINELEKEIKKVKWIFKLINFVRNN